MRTNSRLDLVLVLAGSAAFGIALELTRRNARRNVEKRQRNREVQTWEDEGGSVATPVAAQHRS